MSTPIVRKTVYEYETAFCIKISQAWFEILKRTYHIENVKVLWYYDDETRFTDSMFQKKKPLKTSTQVLKLLSKNIFIPISRTTSVEILTPVNLDFGSITTFISRYTFVGRSKTIRLCLEARATADGGSFFLCGEIEYEKEIFLNYELLIKEENTLMSILDKKFGQYLALMVTEEKSFYEQNFTRIEPEIMSSIPSRRFSKFYQEKPLLMGQLVAIVYKFDGFKARIYCGARNQIYYLDDMKILGQIKSDLFNTTPFLIYQLEIMTDYVIITDVIGAYVGNRLYAAEPLDTFKHFDYLKSFVVDKTLDVPHWGPLKILVQSKINWTADQELPTKEDMPIALPFDGYLVISCNKIYKYKIPTIDVEMKNRSLFLRNAANALSIDMFRGDVENENGIYEICPHKKSYKILRKRLDRDFASTEEELIEFEEERKYFQRHLTSIPIQDVSQNGTVIHGVTDLSKEDVYFPKGIVQLLDGLYDIQALEKCALQYSNLENKNMLRFTGKLINKDVSEDVNKNDIKTHNSNNCVYTNPSTSTQSEVFAILDGLLESLKNKQCELTTIGFDQLLGQIETYENDVVIQLTLEKIKKYVTA